MQAGGYKNSMNRMMNGTSVTVGQVRPGPSDERPEPAISGKSITWVSRMIFPREHGAWGIVSFPFATAMIVAGGWMSVRTLSAALTVIALFLLRAPTLVLLRRNSNRAQENINARWSAGIYSSVALIAGGYLLTVLPRLPLLILGVGTTLLAFVTLFFTLKNQQRNPLLQVIGTIGLTASSLPAYLAARGRLDAAAFWIWALFAVHSIASVLLVHARLEWMIASRKPETDRGYMPHRRDALLAQAGVIALMVVLIASGRPSLALPFLPVLLIHAWEFRRMTDDTSRKISLQHIGYMQLGGSIAFSLLLIAIF